MLPLHHDLEYVRGAGVYVESVSLGFSCCVSIIGMVGVEPTTTWSQTTWGTVPLHPACGLAKQNETQKLLFQNRVLKPTKSTP